ncbi:UbiX family flavin prenyltransferase [Streptomyces sp. DSM 44917]|uniref:Flavin prenyltransferase UbiX n=1 Tax=Streptomyces boetiae TaxID=3075541 RepID=A0ABU2L564_9ACTN|nr:UbiX family flavin prenyltransferase [Streptomyces sp. DSM 44917]MDT0306463.1 UbiX family flavin prenyltransferase [Streptomyces sp. DSM 44917]
MPPPPAPPAAPPRRLVVAITGASGAAYGLTALRLLREDPGVETHLVVTRGARATIREELGTPVPGLAALADVVHSEGNLGASIASGSFRAHGMLVAPCSVKTLSGIATSCADNLVVRAADVMLKERRRLVLLLRETPLHLGHLRLMTAATEAGAVVMPPVPAFYAHPKSLDDMVEFTVVRALDLLDAGTAPIPRWRGNDAPPRTPHP